MAVVANIYWPQFYVSKTSNISYVYIFILHLPQNRLVIYKNNKNINIFLLFFFLFAIKKYWFCLFKLRERNSNVLKILL